MIARVGFCFGVCLVVAATTWTNNAAAKGQTCNLANGYSCPGDEVCLLAWSECRSNPGGDDDICGALDPCASSYYCTGSNPPRCTSKKNNGSSCSSNGQCKSGRCLYGKCQSNAEGSRCSGSGIDKGTCNSGLFCLGTYCVDGKSGDTCVGVGKGSCNDGLVCDALAGRCREVRPVLGEVCGLAVCIDSLACIDGICSEKLEAGDTCAETAQCQSGLHCVARVCTDGASKEKCTGIGQGTCNSGLVCDGPTGECRGDPPNKGEVCHITTGACSAAYYCDGGRCVDRKKAGEDCSGLGVGTCESGLICDGGNSKCRHNPPLQDEPCGIGVPCADGLFCPIDPLSQLAATCQPRGEAGDTCGGIGQGSCAETLICDGRTATCRNEPPLENEPCGLGVPCADGLYCSAPAFICLIPAKAGDMCYGLGRGSCEDGLICDGGTHTCRNDPPVAGQACGLGVPCDGAFYCNEGKCEDRLAVGSDCSSSGQCVEEAYCQALTSVCVVGAGANEACVGIGQGNCAGDLICDGGTSTCRNVPSQVGQACGLGVPCDESGYCNAGTCAATVEAGQSCADNAAACADGTRCAAGTCVTEGDVGEQCWGVLRGTCKAGLICTDGACTDGNSAEGQNCGLFAACGSGLFCDDGSCAQRKRFGEICEGDLDNSNCELHLTCMPSFFDGTDPVGTQRCAMQPGQRRNEAECQELYEPEYLSNAESMDRTITFGTAIAGGAGVAGSTEGGVFYTASGKYGCYYTTCVGVEADVFIGTSFCNGYELAEDVSGPSVVAAATVGEVISTTFAVGSDEFGGPATGHQFCWNLAGGLSPIPASVGAFSCNTEVQFYNWDDNEDGISNRQARRLGLNPVARDSDDDGVDDAAELGSVDNPKDSDDDGVLDALEPGALAHDAGSLVLTLLDGSRVTVTTVAGERLSEAHVTAAPVDMTINHVPRGLMHWTSSVAIAGGGPLTLVFDKPVPPDGVFYTVGADGVYMPVPPERISATQDGFVIDMGDAVAGVDRDGELNAEVAMALAIYEPLAPVTPDAGVPTADAGVDAPTADVGVDAPSDGMMPSPGRDGGGCACGIGRNGESGAALWLLILGAWLVLRRFKRERR